jgi:hypothetical protein
MMEKLRSGITKQARWTDAKHVRLALQGWPSCCSLHSSCACLV